MATRVFRPDEAVMVPADKIVGVELTMNGWYIPRSVIEQLDPRERDSLFYALGQKFGGPDFSVEPTIDGTGWVLVPYYDRALRRFMVR